MKKNADRERKEQISSVREKVYLLLQPYRQTSMAQRWHLKLAPRFYGPYKVEARIGAVAYRLKLPEGALIHPIFHISQLKRCIGQNAMASSKLHIVDQNGVLCLEPKEILDRCVWPVKNQPMTELLVRWQGQSSGNATWENFHKLKSTFPHLVDKVFLRGG